MKYYVSFGGNHKATLLAGNSYNACIRVFKLYFSDDDKNPETLPTFFRVSQRGFDEHDDDELIGTDGIIKLMMMSNKAKKELKILNKKD